MANLNALPGESRLSRERELQDCIITCSHLAFEVEAAERHGASERAVAELRVDYHQAMVKLLGLTPGWCPEAAEKNASARRGHLDRLSEWRATLDRLRAQEG